MNAIVSPRWVFIFNTNVHLEIQNRFNIVPDLFFDWKLVSTLCGRKTPVPHDLLPDSRKIACIPGPPAAQLGPFFCLCCGLELDL